MASQCRCRVQGRRAPLRAPVGGTWQAVLTAIIEAANDPTRYQRIDSYCQIIRVWKFPYSLIYQVKEESIRIIAVMHQRRKPGYWKARAGS